MLMDQPPCWRPGPNRNPRALAHYNRVVHGHTELRADWARQASGARTIDRQDVRLADSWSAQGRSRTSLSSSSVNLLAQTAFLYLSLADK